MSKPITPSAATPAAGAPKFAVIGLPSASLAFDDSAFVAPDDFERLIGSPDRAKALEQLGQVMNVNQKLLNVRCEPRTHRPPASARSPESRQASSRWGSCTASSSASPCPTLSP
jgi:hypothetical protein